MGIFRFILAFNVILYHLLEVPNIGALAVYSFFILSGFLMTYIMHHTYSYDPKGCLKYALNRFWRLYPVYWILFFISLLLFFFLGISPSLIHPYMSFPASLEAWLANLSIFYPSLHPVTYPIRVAPASWALTIEIVFYIAIGLGISRNLIITWFWVIISVMYLFYKILVGSTFNIGYGNIFSASLPFSLGALSYFYQKNIYQFISGKRFAPHLVVILFSLNIVISANSVMLVGQDNAWKVNLLSMYLNLVFSALLVILLSKIKVTYRRIDKLLGDFSYPMYLFHWSGAYVAYTALGSYCTVAGFLFAVIFTLVVSWAVNEVVMHKIDKIRENIKNKQLTVPYSSQGITK
ncbi:acyltransferase [Catenovulum sp. 2E275]|uniref:acyltransferase family protein n=1 Tax=Catenovulum sp. 2E275 TaxID=2980497 RepID=UPI0021CFF169|nr:acyltransferase [Catenovulum sp. 2E275]MCU4675552.1 acyltransferase [Catenovulum sp. 2E275]